MKKRGISLMLVLCLLFSMLPITAWAYEPPTSGSCGANVRWSLSNSGVLRIYGKGEMQSFYDTAVGHTTAPWQFRRGAVKSIVIESGVTSIGAGVFSGLSGATSVTIPNSVTSIGDYAFENCYALQGVKLPKNLTYLGAFAFEETSITNVTIPKGVTTVHRYAFNRCDNLINVTFEGDLQNIGEHAFYACSLLESVTFKGSFSGNIGKEAFAYCKHLTRFDVPAGTEIIYDRAFDGCASLAEVTLPEGLKTILADAFSQTALKHVAIPSTVDYMNRPFSDPLEGLTMYSSTVSGTVSIGAINIRYVHIIGDAPNVDNAVFGNRTDQFIVYYDEGTTGWTHPTWHGYVTDVWGSDTLRKSGICGHNGNLSWNLEYGTLTISGNGPMKDYSQTGELPPWYPCRYWVERIVIEDGVTSVGDYAFYELANATDVSIPAGVCSIGAYSFYNCRSLNAIDIPESVSTIGSYSFSECDSLKEIDIPEGVTTIGDYAFYHCSYLEKVTMADTVTSIGSDVFRDCHRLAAVKLSKNLKIIPYNAFCSCALTEIELPEGLDSIESGAFYACFQLKSVEIPSTVTQLSGFKNCGLTKVTIHASEIFIYPDVFYECKYLTTICFTGDVPEMHGSAFTGITATAYYPEENTTWTENVMQNYGGNITWKAHCTEARDSHFFDDDVDGTCNCCGIDRVETVERIVVHMFRMYNPNTGEHFYTGSTEERDNLIGHGWQYEGIGFTFAANTGSPVHRLFQPSTGEHLYTMDEAEKDKLMAEGWNYEGIAFNSAFDTEAVQHRLHNPNASVGAYHFTFSIEEKDNLIAAGWEYQGIGWYSCWK